MKKIIATVLAATMTITSMAFAASPSEFNDIPNNWAKEGIENAIQNGLLNGNNGKVNPDNNLTRAEMAAIVNRALKAEKTGDISSFTDVSSDKWYYNDLAKAIQMGTIKGSGSTMRPEAPITREETFAVLARVIKLNAAGQSAISSFEDASEVSAWAVPEIGAMVQAGFAQGSAGKLNPKSNITRAEFAVMMDRILNQYISVAGEVTAVSGKNVMINVPGVTLKNATIEGDLYIGDGVGGGDVILEGTTVKGRLVVRGGGENSVKINGASKISDVVAAKSSGNVRIAVAKEASVKTVSVIEGSNNVTVEGNVNSVVVNASNITVTAQKATLSRVSVEGAQSNIVLDKSSTAQDVTIAAKATGAKATIAGKVTNLSAEATNSVVQVSGSISIIKATEGADKLAVSVAKEGTVTSVATKAAGTTISGAGKVTNVQANANNVKVNTSGTKVEAATGTTGVMAGDQTVKAGSTTTVGSSQPTSNTGSGGGGGGYNPPAPTVNQITGISVVLSDNATPITATKSGDKWVLDASSRPASATVTSIKITTKINGIFKTVSVGNINTNESITAATLLKTLEKFGNKKESITLAQISNAAAGFDKIQKNFNSITDISVSGTKESGYIVALTGKVTANSVQDIPLTIELKLPKVID